MSGAANLEGMSEATLRELAAISVEVGNNPDTRIDFLRLAKKANPARQYPELDALEREAKMREDFDARMKAEQAEREKLDLLRQRDLMIEAAINSGQVKDRGEFEKIEKHGIDSGISKFSTAFEHYQAAMKQSEPSGNPVGDPTRPTMPNIPDLKEKFGGNIHKWADHEAHLAMAEAKKLFRTTA